MPMRIIFLAERVDLDRLVRLARPFDATRVAKRNFVATASCVRLPSSR
jgi:hypothetical protein